MPVAPRHGSARRIRVAETPRPKEEDGMRKGFVALGTVAAVLAIAAPAQATVIDHVHY
jgi:hypothetical protein